MKADVTIVGCGLAGCTLAERLATEYGLHCLIIEKRKHVAGNCFDAHDRHGVLLHEYGPHYFRTNSDKVRDYLSRFTGWRPADYRILSFTHGKYFSFPINLTTFEQIIGHPSTQEEMEEYLKAKRVPIANPANAEEAVLSQVGHEMYEMFFKGYTQKQWNRDPRELDASVCRRIPIRTYRDERYFDDKFQAIPDAGYTRMVERIINHPKIQVLLGADAAEVLPQLETRHLFYTGPIDTFYSHRFGRLPYRSLRFERDTYQVEYHQPAVQVNYPNEHRYTRTVEVKHVTGQNIPVTTVLREYPEEYNGTNEPYYPILTEATRDTYRQYAAAAEKEERITFVGRLGTYQYYNMDQVVAQALQTFEKTKEKIVGQAPTRYLDWKRVV